MAFPTGWGRKCALTVPAAQISGTSHTDFPVLLTLANLPSEMFDSDGSYPALNGGGDIRFSSDSAGTTQLACEIVSFVTDANPANGSAEIWVKIPTLATNAGSGTTFYIWYNKSGETQPAVTDTYGRNAVWADYEVVVHMESTTDSTGNTTPTTNGDSGYTGFFGSAYNFNGSNDRFDAVLSTPINEPFTFQATATSDGYGADDCVISVADKDTPDDQHRINVVSSKLNYSVYDGTLRAIDSGVAPLIGGWRHIHAVAAASNDREIFVDGATCGTSTSTTVAVNIDRMTLGTTADSSAYGWWDGQIDEARFRNSALSADWVATEYNAANDPAAFVSDGTPESVGGGTNYDETYSATATADLGLTEAWALNYAESFGASAASSLALSDAWTLAYAETFAASAAATLTLTDTYESPSVAYDETYAAVGAGALALTEAWSLDYAETLTTSAAAALALSDTWALDYAETYAAGATGDLSLTHAYAVGNHYAETYAATAISALTLTDAYSAQYSETYAASAAGALTLSEAWALGYAATYQAVGVTGLALTDAYDTPAPGVFDETYAASAAAALDLTHLFYTPAAIPQVTNPTLQATGAARTLQTSGTVRTLRGRQTIH